MYNHIQKTTDRSTEKKREQKAQRFGHTKDRLDPISIDSKHSELMNEVNEMKKQSQTQVIIIV